MVNQVSPRDSCVWIIIINGSFFSPLSISGSRRHPVPGAESGGPGRDRLGRRPHRHGQVSVPRAKTAGVRHCGCHHEVSMRDHTPGTPRLHGVRPDSQGHGTWWPPRTSARTLPPRLSSERKKWTVVCTSSSKYNIHHHHQKHTHSERGILACSSTVEGLQRRNDHDLVRFRTGR